MGNARYEQFYEDWVQSTAKAALAKLDKGKTYKHQSDDLGIELSARIVVDPLMNIEVLFEPEARMYYALVYMELTEALFKNGAIPDRSEYSEQKAHFSLFFFPAKKT